jgi:ubiquinone/menaquinone biosynthesis C-methylase UbiE
MKKVKDLFSGHSAIYRKYRPAYPQDLYRAVLNNTSGRSSCWDCATGNGQVASELARQFEKVYATDISRNQVEQAPIRNNIAYSTQRAEKTDFAPHSFDLITVAQALHWFDIQAFFREVTRVGRPGGVLAVWGYGLLRFNHVTIDKVVANFYEEVVGPYWDGERRHIDSKYETIPFPFEVILRMDGFQIEKPMDLAELKGYLTSWSSVQNYVKANGTNPVLPLIASLEGSWGKGRSRTARFPVFGKIGKIS